MSLGFRILCFVILVSSLGCKSRPPEKEIVDNALANAPRFPIGHTVRIASTPTTQAVRLAGQVGNLTGFTTPSQTGEKVIGEAKDDIAFAVEFKNPDALMLLTPELI